jgi:hypothetical protein
LLKIETTTSFFNNTDYGNSIPNVIPQKSLLKHKKSVMLDSWLSVGAAGEDLFGIMKENNDSVISKSNEGNFLKNKIGDSFSGKDGFLEGANVPRPTFFAIDEQVEIFGNKRLGGSFILSNGAWACLGGSVGPDSLTTNRVLIAQMTTDGDFSFELNIQIGSPLPGKACTRPNVRRIL